MLLKLYNQTLLSERTKFRQFRINYILVEDLKPPCIPILMKHGFNVFLYIHEELFLFSVLANELTNQPIDNSLC